MMQKMTGQEIDYDAFKSEFDKNPQLKDIIDKFDETGITIKTKNKVKEPGVPGDKAKAKAAVNTSAKRAAAKMIG